LASSALTTETAWPVARGPVDKNQENYIRRRNARATKPVSSSLNYTQTQRTVGLPSEDPLNVFMISHHKQYVAIADGFIVTGIDYVLGASTQNEHRNPAARL
jgi:hypothetical protein